jgi:hypothetical protein
MHGTVHEFFAVDNCAELGAQDIILCIDDIK